MQRLGSLILWIVAGCRVGASASPKDASARVVHVVGDGVVATATDAQTFDAREADEREPRTVDESDPQHPDDDHQPGDSLSGSTTSGSPPTITASPAAIDLAHQHFVEGARAFEIHDFGRAAAEFSAADTLVPKAALLFNVARARESMGDLGGARNTYASVMMRPDADTMRDAVVEAIGRIDDLLRLRSAR